MGGLIRLITDHISYFSIHNHRQTGHPCHHRSCCCRGSTPSRMLSEEQYSSSKALACRTTPAHTSFCERTASPVDLPWRNRCNVEGFFSGAHTEHCFMTPHTCSMALSLGCADSSEDNLTSPFMGDIVSCVSWFWSVLSAELQKLETCGVWREGDFAALQPVYQLCFVLCWWQWWDNDSPPSTG